MGRISGLDSCIPVMRLAFASIIALLPVTGVLGGQIPVVGGVIGGVPSASSAKEFISFPQVLSNVTTPGKLRVVENSGICGK